MWRVEDREETKTEVVKVQLGDEPIIGMKVPAWMRGAVRAALRAHEAQLHLQSTCARPLRRDGEASCEGVRRLVPMAGRPWSVTTEPVKQEPVNAEAVTAESVKAECVKADSVKAGSVKAEAEPDTVRVKAEHYASPQPAQRGNDQA
jgi:hypothetical protein